MCAHRSALPPHPWNIWRAHIAFRDRLALTIAEQARSQGATAAHLIGSLAHETADPLSDVDVWVTFPDSHIGAAVAQRTALLRSVASVLLFHEAPGNRPVGGSYTLALLAAPAGLLECDLYLAPQRTSRLPASSRPLFATVPIADGPWQLDTDALHATSRQERIDWLLAMLFIAIKKVARRDDSGFLPFIAQRFAAISATYQLNIDAPPTLSAFADLEAGLTALRPVCTDAQGVALRAIEDFLALVQHTWLTNLEP